MLSDEKSAIVWCCFSHSAKYKVRFSPIFVFWFFLSQTMKGKIFLIPSFLGDTPSDAVFPAYNIAIINSLKHFIVEDLRSARRFLKLINRDIVIDDLTFQVLGKRTRPEDVPAFLSPAEAGENIGIISEAGCPGVADPGADAVRIAHERGLQVVPLVGPSSILMAMMASGMNGQNFAFVGYLPVEKAGNVRAIRNLEERSLREAQTQIFIETPFRNLKMFADLLFALRPSTRLCVACDITTQSEMIVTHTVKEWRAMKHPDIDKRPTIFLIQA